MRRDIQLMINTARGLGWGVSFSDSDYNMAKNSPCGQDFNICVSGDTLEEVIDSLQEYIDDFDVSYETYLWLDSTGHGTNGSPYDMKDLYEDMEACVGMMEELLEEFEMLYGELEEEEEEEE